MCIKFIIIKPNFITHLTNKRKTNKYSGQSQDNSKIDHKNYYFITVIIILTKNTYWPLCPFSSGIIPHKNTIVILKNFIVSNKNKCTKTCRRHIPLVYSMKPNSINHNQCMQSI